MIKFDSQYHLYDITPLENMFIQQYLVKSPGDYVKIYIFCLNSCYYPDGSNITYDSIASALKLSRDDVQRALRYWSRLGIMTVESKDDALEIEMHSMKDIFLKCDFSDKAELYKYADFNNALSEAFAPRILDTQDYLLYQDMMTIFEVSEEYVIEAVKYSVKAAKTTDIPYKYVEKVIEARKNENINDVDALRKYIEKNDAVYREICSILKYLGMNRAPTVPELNCYKKWIDEYHFTFDSIKEACEATLSANTPTIKYLDAVLTGLHDKKATTPEQITAIKENTDNYRNKVRKLLYYLGLRGAPSAVQLQKYIKWEKDYGYNEEAVSIAASMITNSKNPYDALDNLLESFYMNGVSDANGMLAYMNQKHIYDDDIKKVQKELGKAAEIVENEREYMKRWRETLKIPTDVILFAAQLAATAEKPWIYMNKVLLTWSKNNITTLEAAQNYNNSFTANNTATATINKGKKYSFTNIDKHSYTEQDYDNMFDNFGGFSSNS